MENNYQWPPQGEGKPPKKKISAKKLGTRIIIGMLIFFVIIGGLTCDATVVTKRTHVWGDHSRTNYYATFQFESGDRLELEIPRDRFGYLVEGDTGKLSFQGTRFLGFERQ